MSMLATARAGVEAAFAAAGDLIASVTWERLTVGAYDTTSGSQTTSFSTVTVRAIEDKVSYTTATRLKLSASAIRIWVPAVDFEGVPVSFEPAIKDRLTHRGKVYTVSECQFEGAKALWEVHADV